MLELQAKVRKAERAWQRAQEVGQCEMGA